MKGFKVGFLFNWRSLWVGLHYSSYNRRFCLNLIPCCTVWLCLPGGVTPSLTTR